ncbi:hypothetical protein [Streptosporangium saharense]|uniref:Uncharacterized protein n=1 Tax=Streptosporangium saharense TaxID=1706840 RepID=A0A7W7QUG0_9ACTN|nr:hypothetical protein [Streptosporangium saharense]MBB4919718.1 hypothetical protein [Streptosporangium saharense]
MAVRLRTWRRRGCPQEREPQEPRSRGSSPAGRDWRGVDLGVRDEKIEDVLDLFARLMTTKLIGPARCKSADKRL